jgi:hypothetical protein
MKVLGLDVSTSCTGWSILDEDSRMVAAGAIDLKKCKTIYEKAGLVRNKIVLLSSDWEIQSVYIEENLQAFRPGFSSAKTLMTLARFNGMTSLVCSDIFGFDPQHINVNIARKSVGLKVERESKCGINTKEQVLSWVQSDLKSYDLDFVWPIKTLKSGKNKGLTRPDVSCYDIADAYVIAKSGIALEL